jgi:hypothetical protein
MKRLEGKDYLLFAYCHIVVIIFYKIERITKMPHVAIAYHM